MGSRGSCDGAEKAGSRRYALPHFEFVCHECEKGSLVTLPGDTEYEHKLTCVHCGSTNIELRAKLNEVSTEDDASPHAV